MPYDIEIVIKPKAGKNIHHEIESLKELKSILESYKYYDEVKIRRLKKENDTGGNK